MMNFSQRYGHVPVRSTLQIDGTDDGLRNRLWNLICTRFFQDAPHFRGANNDYLPLLPLHQAAVDTFKHLWHNYFKKATDSIGTSYTDALNNLKGYILKCNWYEVYDLLEFLADFSPPYSRQSFIDSVNAILKEE